MLSIVKSMCLQGLEGILINVEVDISSGMPCWYIVGLADTNIKEAKERVRTAIKNCGIEVVSRKYIINLSPSNIRKDGAILDLAIAVGVLASMNIINVNNTENTIFIGELSLNGDLNRINGILPICIEAKKKGIKRIILPKNNAKEASIVKDIEIIGVQCLKDVINYINGKKKIKPQEVNIEEVLNNKEEELIDYSDIKGNELAKRALEISAAGRTSLSYDRKSGSGKNSSSNKNNYYITRLNF